MRICKFIDKIKQQQYVGFADSGVELAGSRLQNQKVKIITKNIFKMRECIQLGWYLLCLEAKILISH